MGKVTRIEKSRKEFKCSKCGKVIAKGSPYLRGSLNFHPDIIRCTDCGLKSYEVTTSDYIQRVGAIVYDWDESYAFDDYQAIADDLTEIRDELLERLENMPEALQEADTGQILQERIDELESAISGLEDIDEDGLKQEVLDENVDEDDENCEYKDATIDNLADYEELQSEYESKMCETIDGELSNISV